MICKNCGNDVIPKMSPVQILIGVVLVFFFGIPAILYFVFCNKKTCPNCGRNVYRKEGELISSESAGDSKVVKDFKPKSHQKLQKYQNLERKNSVCQTIMYAMKI